MNLQGLAFFTRVDLYGMKSRRNEDVGRVNGTL